MGNRSRFVAVTAAAVGVAALRARRHARFEHAAEGIADSIMPTVAGTIPREPEPTTDEAHAPGHQHLGPIDDEQSPIALRSRPWTKHRRSLRHLRA